MATKFKLIITCNVCQVRQFDGPFMSAGGLQAKALKDRAGHITATAARAVKAGWAVIPNLQGHSYDVCPDCRSVGLENFYLNRGVKTK